VADESGPRGRVAERPTDRLPSDGLGVAGSIRLGWRVEKPGERLLPRVSPLAERGERLVPGCEPAPDRDRRLRSDSRNDSIERRPVTAEGELPAARLPLAAGERDTDERVEPIELPRLRLPKPLGGLRRPLTDEGRLNELVEGRLRLLDDELGERLRLREELLLGDRLKPLDEGELGERPTLLDELELGGRLKLRSDEEPGVRLRPRDDELGGRVMLRDEDELGVRLSVRLDDEGGRLKLRLDELGGRLRERLDDEGDRPSEREDELGGRVMPRDEDELGARLKPRLEDELGERLKLRELELGLRLKLRLDEELGLRLIPREDDERPDEKDRLDEDRPEEKERPPEEPPPTPREALLLEPRRASNSGGTAIDRITAAKIGRQRVRRMESYLQCRFSVDCRAKSIMWQFGNEDNRTATNQFGVLRGGPGKLPDKQPEFNECGPLI